MKTYITPKADLVELNAVDIIALSADDELAEYDDTVNAPSGWFN